VGPIARRRAIRSAISSVHPETGDNEETKDMNHTDRHRQSTWRASLGRVAVVALSIGGLSASAFASATAAAAATPTTATKISTVKNSKLGTILVAGTTVYTLKPSKTACTAACQKFWRPVLLPKGVAKPTAGNGVDATKLGTVAAAGGALQATYGGKPLYWFSLDKGPGQVHGNMTNQWGKWSTVVVKKSGSVPSTNAGTGGASF
jgi:predicted lipoprotein with Yx(FWY)xxD motif